VTEGISPLRGGSSAYRATGAETMMPYFLALLAGACEIAGELEQGLILILPREIALAAAGKSAAIPPRQKRLTPPEFDRDLYKARHLIENFFCKLKQFRAIATRYDKTARNFLAAIHLAAASIWLN
jgi:hypothetical protein